mgnify:FL=1
MNFMKVKKAGGLVVLNVENRFLLVLVDLQRS